MIFLYITAILKVETKIKYKEVLVCALLSNTTTKSFAWIYLFLKSIL